MKSRWLMKIAAVLCALCLAMGVMSQTVFARDDEAERPVYVPEEPEATFVVLDGETAPEPEVTDNRTTLPVYVDGEQAGQCVLFGGQPYMRVTELCQILGPDAQVADNGNAVSMAVNGLVLTAQMGQPYLVCNGRYLYLKNGPQVVDGAVALPMEDLVKCLGLTAYWDKANWSLSLADTEVTPLANGEKFYDETDVFWLSRLIFAMAAEQPLQVQLAVGNVCVNRIGSDRFAGQNNVYQVIFAKNQFDVVTNGMVYAQPDEAATVAAKMALEGCDVTGGANYMAEGELGDGYVLTAAFGSFRFYKAV